MSEKIPFDTLLELAKLDVDPSERKQLESDMQSILSYVDQIQALELPLEDFSREVVDARSYREDDVAACPAREVEAVLEEMPGRSKEGYLEAHATIEQ